VLLCRDTFAKAVRTQHWCETKRYCFLVFLYRERLGHITNSVGVSLSFGIRFRVAHGTFANFW